MIKQNGKTLSGSIIRNFPPNEKHHRWAFKGRMVNQQIIATFWPENSETLGYGSWFFLQVNENHFEGIILAYSKYLLGAELEISDTINPIKVELKRYRFS